MLEKDRDMYEDVSHRIIVGWLNWRKALFVLYEGMVAQKRLDLE
jgi:regulator of sigma D